MSNRHIYNLGPHRWSMDDCALYDHPKAIRTVREIAGNKRIHVICHCLGSMSFVMSLFARQVPGLASVIANRSEEHTSELQSLMRNSYAVFCLKKNTALMFNNKTNNLMPSIRITTAHD